MHASIHASIHTCIHCFTLHYITYIHTYHTIPYHTIPYIPYMHACIHAYMHAVVTVGCIDIYIYTVGCIDIYIYIYYCSTVFTYIYIHMCVISCSLSAPPGLFAKKTTYKLFTPERLQRHPFRHVWLEEGTPFHWFIIMFLSEKKHLQLTESVEFSWKPPYPFRSFPYFSIVGSGGGTPSFSALWSSWNLGHPRPLGGGRVLDPGNVVKRRSLLLRKNTPCSTEWIYYKYIYLYIYHIIHIDILYII